MITITMAAMAMTIAYPSLPRGDCQSLSRGLGPDRPPPTATVPNSDQSLGPPAFWPNPWQSEPTMPAAGCPENFQSEGQWISILGHRCGG